MSEPIPISAHPAVVRRAGEKLNAAISEAIKKGAPMTIPEPFATVVARLEILQQEMEHSVGMLSGDSDQTAADLRTVLTRLAEHEAEVEALKSDVTDLLEASSQDSRTVIVVAASPPAEIASLTARAEAAEREVERLTEAVQSEWVMVPKEPTEAMVVACENALDKWRKTLNADERILRSRMQDGRMLVSAAPREKHAIRYRAMIAASPTPPLGGEGR